VKRLFAAGLFMVACAASNAQSLRACVNEDDAPHSFKTGRGAATNAGGYDLKLLQALAQRLGMPLQLTWYEAEFEKEVSVAAENAALLGSNVCDVIAGQPLYEPALAKPQMEFAKPPGFDGAPPRRERPFVKVEPLIASAPYRAGGLGVVQAAGAPPFASLADLQGRRVAVGAGTLPGGIASFYRGGLLQKNLVSISPAGNPIDAVQDGRADAAFVETHRFDAWQAAHPGNTLGMPAWRHRIDFNFGFVALQSQRALIDRIDAALADMAARGELAALAQGTALRYQAPQAPAMRAAIGLADLRRE
jgi:ABC-type amino acid transport substrate-binding protein